MSLGGLGRRCDYGKVPQHSRVRSEAVFLELSVHQNRRQDLLKTHHCTSPPESDSMSLGWGLRIFPSRESPANSDDAELESTL